MNLCKWCGADWHSTEAHYLMDPNGNSIAKHHRDAYIQAKVMWHLERCSQLERWVRKADALQNETTVVCAPKPPQYGYWYAAAAGAVGAWFLAAGMAIVAGWL